MITVEQYFGMAGLVMILSSVFLTITSRKRSDCSLAVIAVSSSMVGIVFGLLWPLVGLVGLATLVTAGFTWLLEKVVR